MNQQLVQCSRLSGQWGTSEYAVGETERPLQCLSACPVLIGGRELVAGNGGPRHGPLGCQAMAIITGTP